MGSRIRSEGLPDSKVFFIDVDLWHTGPGMRLLKEVREQFYSVVQQADGRVTDFRSVADTYLLARVEGTAATLEALLAYDRVAYVDFPPVISEQEYTIFDEVSVPEELELPEVFAREEVEVAVAVHVTQSRR